MNLRDQRRRDLKKEFKRYAHFEIGDKFKSPWKGKTFTLSDFAYRWEKEEFVYWFEDEMGEENGEYDENFVLSWERIDEDEDDDDPDVVGPLDKPY